MNQKVFALLLAGLMSSCSAPDDRVRLEVTGSSTIAPLMSEMAKRYESRYPGVRIDIQTGGSSRGIADAASGVADIGMSSRALKDSEKGEVVSYRLAMDGVALVVHADNPVKSLSDEQIVGIYTGAIENWKEVGGREAPINCINRAEGRSELELFQGFFGIAPAAFQPDMIAGENQHGLKTVASDENAIIYLSIGASEYEVLNGTPIKLLPMRGVEASAEMVAAGTFPLSRPLILIVSSESSAPVKRFIDYVLSSEVHDLIRQQSYVPVQ
ncbi:MAG: phosphate ABC transporter substrate-binding protein [Verrucomicrobiales bacterium]|nr:phosphate ABC transporter substrate-binding protein [Verrucomicrobiales bacterium]